jgi:hypothetical protein
MSIVLQLARNSITAREPRMVKSRKEHQGWLLKNLVTCVRRTLIKGLIAEVYHHIEAEVVFQDSGWVR